MLQYGLLYLQAELDSSYFMVLQQNWWDNALTQFDDEIKNFVNFQKLGYVATVSSDGTPNLSPKGTISILDDSRMVFANIRSPQTIENLS